MVWWLVHEAGFMGLSHSKPIFGHHNHWNKSHTMVFSMLAFQITSSGHLAWNQQGHHPDPLDQLFFFFHGEIWPTKCPLSILVPSLLLRLTFWSQDSLQNLQNPRRAMEKYPWLFKLKKQCFLRRERMGMIQSITEYVHIHPIPPFWCCVKRTSNVQLPADVPLPIAQPRGLAETRQVTRQASNLCNDQCYKQQRWDRRTWMIGEVMDQ